MEVHDDCLVKTNCLLISHWLCLSFSLNYVLSILSLQQIKLTILEACKIIREISLNDIAASFTKLHQIWIVNILVISRVFPSIKLKVFGCGWNQRYLLLQALFIISNRRSNPILLFDLASLIPKLSNIYTLKILTLLKVKHLASPSY